MHPRTVALHNETNRIRAAERMRDEFSAHLESAKQPESVPATVEVSGYSIKVACFGHIATASPRIVRDSKGQYVVEYVFVAPSGEKIHALCRMYLTHQGVIRTSAEEGSGERLCDFNNLYVKQNIILHVGEALLASPIFSPAEEPFGVVG